MVGYAQYTQNGDIALVAPIVTPTTNSYWSKRGNVGRKGT